MASGGYKLQAWLYIVFWISVSCTMILFNKAVLDQMEFPYPMFLTTWHMFFATVMTQIMARTSNWLPGFKAKLVDTDVLRTQILPVSLCFSISLVLANTAYIYLSVSYIQMLKAFTPVAVLIFSFFAGLEKTSCMELYIVMVICTGVAMASVGETFFSWIGFTCQALAILAESSRLVLTNLLMRNLKLGVCLSVPSVYLSVCLSICVCPSVSVSLVPAPHNPLSSPSLSLSLSRPPGHPLRPLVIPLLHRSSLRVAHWHRVLLLGIQRAAVGAHVHDRVCSDYGHQRLYRLHPQHRRGPPHLQHLCSRADSRGYRQGHPPRVSVSRRIRIAGHPAAVCRLRSGASGTQLAQGVQKEPGEDHQHAHVPVHLRPLDR